MLHIHLGMIVKQDEIVDNRNVSKKYRVRHKPVCTFNN